jgi:UDP-N-acetylmuramoylalanine--D-glutamate ligase
VLVVGLGRSGRAAALHLAAAGARVTATDRAAAAELGPIPGELAAEGVALALGGHRAEDFGAAELIVLSPGVPTDLPPLAQARERGVPIVSEIDLVPPEIGERVIAITGSNGKSTTTALAAAMLDACTGREGVPSGNFGTPLIEAAADDHPGRWYALELSSFQLETIQTLRAAAAVLLNVRPDHIDRHGSFEEYRAAKAKVALLRAPGALLVYDADDADAAEIAEHADPPRGPVSTREPAERGAYLDDRELVLEVTGAREALMKADEVPLHGRHNLSNTLAAAAACRACGVDLDAIRRGVRHFAGLPHRLQEVGTAAGVRFIDDSKATNVDAAIEAIGAAPGRRLFVLLGGRDKAGRFGPLADALSRRGARALTFGEAGPRIAEALDERLEEPVQRCDAMEQAVRQAAEQAGPGDTVLLAPACASFDAFRSYVHRGEAFARVVESLTADGEREGSSGR